MLCDQNIDHIFVLVNGAPEIVTLASDRDEQLIHVPGVFQTTLFPSKGSCVDRTEFQTPVSDSFVRNDDATLSKQVFNVSKTQREAMLKPDAVSDDSRWETVTPVS